MLRPFDPPHRFSERICPNMQGYKIGKDFYSADGPFIIITVTGISW